MNKIQFICEKIWQVETKRSLFDVRALCAPVWPMIRMKTYYHLAEQSGAFSTPHPKKSGLGYKIAFVLSVLREGARSILRCWTARHASLLVFEHPRSKIVGDVVIDIYSYYYVRDREAAERGSALVLSRTESGRIEKTDGFNRVSIDLIEGLRSIVGKLLYVFIPASSVPIEAIDEICKQTVEDIKKRISSRRKLISQFRRGTIEYLCSYVLYLMLFSWFRHAKEVILVDGYSSRTGLIAAARKKGLRVRELQHGVLGRYHLGYSYPGGADTRYVPDELLVWSEFWEKELAGVWPADISIYGYKYLEDVRCRFYSNIKKEKGTIVVISQGAISAQLAETLWENRSVLYSYRIYYKLHPSEASTWRDSGTLARISDLSNVEMVEQGDIYELFASCEYQLGVFSTALHEGVEFGCKTVLVPLPGIEYMENFKDVIAFDDFISAKAG